MSWLNQKEGIINHYHETDFGTQPIRVIHPMLTLMFQLTSTDFFADLLQQIKAGKLNRKLKMTFGEEPIMIDDINLRTPRIHKQTREIELHESFLSYLWCCCYALFNLYIETIDHPKMNYINGKITHPINEENIKSAKEIFDYAKYIIRDFKTWDKKTLPNPEIYLAEKRNYVEMTNLFYTDAVKFILCHEFIHLKLHIEKIEKVMPDSNYLAFEIDADNNAIDIIKNGIPSLNTPLVIARKLAMENGIIMGILSMFFFSAETAGKRHPNNEDRLTNALEKLNLHDNHEAWGTACIGLQLWDEQFGLGLKWDVHRNSYKELFYKIIQQIKQRE